MARGWRAVAERLGLTLAPAWTLCSIAAVAAAGAWSETLWVALPEELLFRGLAQGELAARSGRPMVAAITVAGLFALAHVVMGAGWSGLLTFFPGLLFGLLRWRSGCLWPAVAAHALANQLWLGGGLNS